MPESSAPAPAPDRDRHRVRRASQPGHTGASRSKNPCQNLLRKNIPRRPLHASADALGDRLAAVAELPPEDLASVLKATHANRPSAADCDDRSADLRPSFIPAQAFKESAVRALLCQPVDLPELAILGTL